MMLLSQEGEWAHERYEERNADPRAESGESKYGGVLGGSVGSTMLDGHLGQRLVAPGYYSIHRANPCMLYGQTPISRSR